MLTPFIFVWIFYNQSNKKNSSYSDATNWFFIISMTQSLRTLGSLIICNSGPSQYYQTWIVSPCLEQKSIKPNFSIFFFFFLQFLEITYLSLGITCCWWYQGLHALVIGSFRVLKQYLVESTGTLPSVSPLRPEKNVLKIKRTFNAISRSWYEGGTCTCKPIFWVLLQ